MLAGIDRLDDDASRELQLAGRLDDDVDAVDADQPGIPRDGGNTLGDGGRDVVGGVADPRPLALEPVENADCPLRRSVGDRNDLDARKRVRADRDASTHVPGSDERDADRPPLPCALLERLVEDDHAGESPRVSLRQTNASA